MTKVNVGSHESLTLSLQQFDLTEENLKMFYNLKGLPLKALEANSVLDGLDESNLKLRHTFFKHQFAIIFEMKMALKTTFRESSH